jgi:hypothetical protein
MLKDAIPLRFGFELVVGNDGLAPPFGYGGQIIQIFEKFLVICNRKHNGGLRPGPVSQILQVGTHVRKITTTQANVDALKTMNVRIFFRCDPYVALCGDYGVSDPYEKPQGVEIVIDTAGLSPKEAAQAIILYMEREGFIGVNDSL